MRERPRTVYHLTGEYRGGSLIFEYLTSVNYSMYHNHNNTLIKCQLVNEGRFDWINVTVTLTGDMIHSHSVTLPGIKAHTNADITTLVPIDIDVKQLLSLSESIRTPVYLAITIGNDTAIELCLQLEIMPYDQWAGLELRPELLASFVTPNHPVLSRISKSASAYLQQATGNADLDEYQSQSTKRVHAQIQAVYEALRSEKIVYASAPPTYEESGQRIRTVDKVLNEKLGTCLDLSLLMASSLEAIGLNPIVIFTKGHAMVGVWLVKDAYIHPVCDDITLLQKSIADNEILVIESTTLTNAQDGDFSRSIDSAKQTLSSEPFYCYIDISRARQCGIRPLPLRINNGTEWTVTEYSDSRNSATGQTDYDRYDLSNYTTEGTVLTKYTIWERKLLDFSLRNNLLNMRMGKKIIPLVSFAIDKLEDAMAAGDSFGIYPFPINTTPIAQPKGLYDSSQYAQISGVVVNDLRQKKLHTFLYAKGLGEALKYVYRASRTSLEENGANNLYLVIGVLKWHESPRSEQPRYAPILLLPIEIVRANNGSGYAIRMRDEDIVLNITLVQLLKQQYDIDLTMLEDLPRDQADNDSVDVNKILAIVSDSIRYQQRWEVLNESLVGLFSFNKFVMWNDIHTNSDRLHQHPIISSLVDGTLDISVEDDDIDAKDADKNFKPEEFTLPIDVDSSQLEAVIASGKGKSFILHGPPGTGKSQTITNMIANALYQGKRVLFVAEKMAALSVVQSRLENIGLAPFCLELHSNKVTKRHFLNQMQMALDVTRHHSPADYKRHSDELYTLRHQLISHVEALHAKQANGLSLYDCITKYLSIDGDTINIDITQHQGIDNYGIETLKDKIIRLDTIFRITGLPSNSPLYDITIKDGSMESERLMKDCVSSLETSLQTWATEREEFSRAFGIELPDSIEGIKWALRFLQQVKDIGIYNSECILLSADPNRCRRLENIAKSGIVAFTEKDHLAKYYTSSILTVDPEELQQKWDDACIKWIIGRYFAKRSVLQLMTAYKMPFKESNLHDVISRLRTADKEIKAFEKGRNDLYAVFGTSIPYDYAGWHPLIGNDDLKKAPNRLKKLPKLQVLIAEVARMLQIPPATATQVMAERCQVTIDQIDLWLTKAEMWKKIIETISRLLTVIDTDMTDIVPLSIGLYEKVQRWKSGMKGFREWYLWSKSREELTADNLQEVVQYIAQGQHSAIEAAKAFEKGIYQAMARQMIDNDDALRYFNGLLFDDVIDRYRQLTSKFQQLSKQQLYCKLASNIPSQTMAAHDTAEIGILKRNIKNGGRGTSIRKIIDQIPTLLPKLCPCMLMSPLSVAQYLDLNNEKFDIVIFDEASQMPTSEAVGAIARGKALVVVGDPKQMPPTSFFATSAVGEEEAYIDDMESILDDCISLSIPSKYLSWHYRSKHESLITFSNTHYYDGRLLTFPSNDDQKSKVTLQYVAGVYDKGKSRSNTDEAQAVVDEVIRRLSDPELRKYSIGIVSFSKVQQDKIEDMLTDELLKHPDLQAIDNNSPEPIFIKNLENVQGDERDVILFSIGYGPDAQGHVSMNFGPLNNAGGERRLNVAVSRARREMIVFSSLRSDQIDLRRSNSLGVLGLKKFLEYAESGNATQMATGNDVTNTDIIASQISEALNEKGYETSTGVGRSQFKVDVAVINPEKTDEYILGILIDGPSYYDTKTVRDREIVQPSVLHSLNWQIMRVYTLDWYERRDEVMNRITTMLQQISHGEIPPIVDNINDQIEEEAIIDEEDNSVQPMGTDYIYADVMAMPANSSLDDMQRNSLTLRYQLTTLINTEQPITNSLLYKRIVKIWGLARVSPHLQDLVDAELKRIKCYRRKNGDRGFTYWQDRATFEQYSQFRVMSDRDIQDVPYTEIANAMLYVIDQQIGINRDDLKRLTANALGYTRLGNNINTATEFVLSKLIKDGVIAEQGGKVMKNN